jgi:hypothetical protein
MPRFIAVSVANDLGRGRSAIQIALSLALVAALASAGRAQDGAAAPVASIDGIAPVYGPLPNLAPSQAPDALPPGAELPLAAAVPPGGVSSNPGSGAPNGDMSVFGEFGAMGSMGGFGGGMHPVDSLRYGDIWFPNAPVKGQATSWQMVGQDFSFTHPLWIDPLNAWSVMAGVANRLIETGAVLPDTGQAYPTDLWNVHLGLRYARQLNDGWVTGGGVSFGSASDHPFASIREMDVGMNAMLRVPQGEHNAWIFSLMYSPTSELAFPLPGVAFSYNPSPQFHANIGLPFMVVWRPTDEWQFQASYMLIHTIHVKAIYRFTDRLRAFAAYDWSNEAYSLLDRPELNDRLFMYDQRVSVGLQATLAPHWTASVAAGFVFNRYSFEGTSFTSGDFDRVNLGDGPFAALNLGVRF